MKTLYINNYNYVRGGAESVFLAEADLMERNGNIVQIFSRKHPNNLPSKYDPFFPKEMVTDSIKPTIASIRSLLQIFYSMDAKQHLAKMLHEIPVDVAHAHNIYGRLTTSVLDLLNKNNIPIVMTLHDYKIICPNYKLMHHGHICEDCKGNTYYMAPWNRCHKNSFFASSIYALETYFNHFFNKYRKNVRYFVSPSIFLKEKLIEFGWPKQQIEYIPNFIEPMKIVPNFSPGNYFLYLGRLSSEKGLLTLVESFMKLTSDKASLKIVGEGPLRHRLETTAKSSPQIQFTGYLSGKALKNAIRDALAIIIPSEWYENAPISILEAFSFGKPVIGSRIGGIPEMIDEGMNGYLFEPGNVDDLTAKLDLVLCTPVERITDLGHAARQKVEREYSSELHYDRLMDLYNRVLKES